MRITILTLTCEFNIEVSPQETILQIKQKVEQLLGVPVASQALTVSGWELVDGLDLEDYPIVTEGTKIDLTIQHTQPSLEHSSKIQIVVKFSSRKINVEVDTTETMEEDFRNLSEYGICEFSEIIVFLKTMSRLVADPPSRKLSLVVQTSSSLLNAASIPLEMKDSSTINDLRELLLMRKILPMDDYIFIHKQRIMRDNCSLRWHGVEDGDCLYVFKGTVSRGGY
ncbi:hypothetical protein CsSME_00027075 [Camellia sinensis var. sinensis]